MPVTIEALMANFSKHDAFEYVADLDMQLSGHVPSKITDYSATLHDLMQIVQVFCPPSAGAEPASKATAAPTSELSTQCSLNMVRLLSRVIVGVLAELPNKVYDTANGLIGHLAVGDGGSVPVSAQVACLVLTDIVEAYPHQISSLLNYAANQLYRLLKKNPAVDGSVVYLLDCVLKVALRLDIDDKFQAKWVRLILKAITQPISVGDDAEGTVLAVKYYVLAFKSILVLTVSAHYQLLLELSASSTLAKLKPEAIMAQQRQFQSNLLVAHEKVFQYGLKSQFAEIRAATVVLLSQLLYNFVDTGKFSAIEYLLDLYPLPPLNLWNESLTATITAEQELSVELKREKNLVSNHDSEGIVEANAATLLCQIGCVETFIMYVQLQLFQNWEYLPSMISYILDLILAKFGDLHNPAHIQNLQWKRTLSQWTTVVRFLVSESGPSVHEILALNVVQKFSAPCGEELSYDSPPPGASLSKDKKRESKFFGFKSSKKTKSKGLSTINPYANPGQAKLIMDIICAILPYGIDFNSLVQSKDGDDANEVLLEEPEDDDDLAEEENKLTAKRSSYISDLLLSLLANNSENIRNYSLVALLEYAQINRSESNQLILQVFQLVSQEFNNTSNIKENGSAPTERNISQSVTVKLLSYSLALLSLIKQSEATMLQNSTIAKILSFCTQNLKHSDNNDRKYLKNAACWITLASLVTFYPDSEFVKLNSSQFLVFWKNLLTSQFISSDINAGSDATQSLEIINNLKLRSLSLVCLLNYIDSVQLTPELSKQLQFLLVKSHKYLLYLESNLEEIGLITSFHPNAFNESDFNPNIVNNLIFSNQVDSLNLPVERQIISLILYNKKVVLQGFVKLSNTLKSDGNSSLVVFLVRVFSDAKMFSRLPGTESTKEKGKKKASVTKQTHEDKDLILLDEEYNYHFGVTSNFENKSSFIDQLNSTASEKSLSMDSFFYQDPFQPLSEISNPTHPGGLWTDVFERMLHLAPVHDVTSDPLVLLLNGYSARHAYAPNLITSLVDLSIQLFQLVFPSLSYKIQFSLLEQLRSSLSAKGLDPLRRKAIFVNITVALHGLLSHLVASGTLLDDLLIELVFEIVEHIDTDNILLVSAGAEIVGMASSLLPKAKADEAIAKYVNTIVNDTSPTKRGKLLFSLAKIHHYSRTGFSEVLNVVQQLIADPHPIMNYYSLQTAASLLENALGNQNLVKSILEAVYANFLDDSFGFNVDNKDFINLRSSYGSTRAMARLVSLCVTSLGPSLRSHDEEFKKKLFHLLLLMSYGIGNSNLQDYMWTLEELLATCQELLVFDSKFAEGYTSWLRDLCEFLVKCNMKNGIGIVSPTSISKSSLFPMTTSYHLTQVAYASLVEMTKLGVQTLTKESLNLSWISMELRPCTGVKNLLTFWIEAKMEPHWFSQLAALFKISSRKLVGPFMELQYQQKLLPLTQRQKKSNNANAIEFTDEEVQNIVKDENGGEDKNQPITWEFKLLIYDLLIKFLIVAEKRPALVKAFEPKIQEVVRMSFLGTTAPIGLIRLRGVELLDRALGNFGHLEDPLYPSVSILEQQQAQIISALIPCFSSDCDAEVIVKAINVSSKFINLPRIKFYSKQRILKTLIFLLEEISSNKFLKFEFLESMAEHGRKAIQLSILNCWAVLNIKLAEQEGSEESEFEEILLKYSDLLTSLWILVLKDLSTLKYNQPKSKELELYSSYWLNFVRVLSLLLEKDQSSIKAFLKEDEESFFFVMFCQCAEALIKNQDVSEVLVSVNRLVQIPELAQTLFNPEIFGEVIDLLDRLLLMEDDIEVKCEVLDTVETLFTVFSNARKDLSSEETQELFELLRVALLPLFDIFPFLRQDFNPEYPSQKHLLSKCSSGTVLIVLKKLLSIVVKMVLSFNGDEVKNDLLACLLFIFAKFYEHNDDKLIGVILPYLKTVVTQTLSLSGLLTASFLTVLNQNEHFCSVSNKSNYVITMMILVTGGVELTMEEAEKMKDVLLECLEDPEIASTGIQSVKSLIGTINNSSALIMKLLLKSLLHSLADDSKVDPKIAFEIVIMFTLSAAVDTDDNAAAMYLLLLPLLLEHAKRGTLGQDYLHEKTVKLLKGNPSAFKTAVNEHLGADQKLQVEDLVKFSRATGTSVGAEEIIELKTFG